MKGKPSSTDRYGQPGNGVLWANGFFSNMPDWIVARECAAASQMLFALKRARVLLMLDDRKISHAYSLEEQRSIQTCVQEAIDVATGMDTIGGGESLEDYLIKRPLEALDRLIDSSPTEETTVISKKTIRERAAMPEIPIPPGFPPIPKIGE